MSHEIVTTYTCDRCGKSAVGRGPEVLDIVSSGPPRWRGPFRPDGWTEAVFPAHSHVTDGARRDLCPTCTARVTEVLKDGES